MYQAVYNIRINVAFIKLILTLSKDVGKKWFVLKILTVLEIFIIRLIESEQHKFFDSICYFSWKDLYAFFLLLTSS